MGKRKFVWRVCLKTFSRVNKKRKLCGRNTLDYFQHLTCATQFRAEPWPQNCPKRKKKDLSQPTGQYSRASTCVQWTICGLSCWPLCVQHIGTECNLMWPRFCSYCVYQQKTWQLHRLQLFLLRFIRDHWTTLPPTPSPPTTCRHFYIPIWVLCVSFHWIGGKTIVDFRTSEARTNSSETRNVTITELLEKSSLSSNAVSRGSRWVQEHWQCSKSELSKPGFFLRCVPWSLIIVNSV